MRFPVLEQELGHEVMTERQNILLLISPWEEDETQLVNAFCGSNWTVRRASNCREAMLQMRESPPTVVLCERDLPDGTWKDIQAALIYLRPSPVLVVISRLAEIDLWAEVLNLGGYDLLQKPLGEKEVRWTVDSVWRHSCSQREQTARTQKAIA